MSEVPKFSQDGGNVGGAAMSSGQKIQLLENLTLHWEMLPKGVQRISRLVR